MGQELKNTAGMAAKTGCLRAKAYPIAVWGAIAALLLAVFLLSSQNSQNSSDVSAILSDRIFAKLKPVIDFIRYEGDYLLIMRVDAIMRKTAHFFLFLAATVLLYHGFRSLRLSRPLCFSLAMFGCVCCALLDEFHQGYVPGRGASMSDVLLDCAGGAFGLLCVFLTWMTGRLYLRAHLKRQIPTQDEEAEE